jgi:hypothetical protein
MSFREVTLPDGSTRTIDTGVEEITHASGVTQRRSVVGLLADKEQRHPGGNPKLDYNRGLQWCFAGETAVYMYPDTPGVFFDAQLQPIDDVTAARAGWNVPALKAQKRKLELVAAAEAKIAAMVSAEREAQQAELAELEAQSDAEPKWETPDLSVAPTGKEKALDELASDGERAWPAVKP